MQKGHKYLFSDVSHTWFEARAECELYGGWLVQIKEFAEFNCLMRHGKREEIHTWYWIDGNDVDDTGVWTHAYDNSDVTYFTPTITCGDACSCPGGGDAFMVHVGGNKHSRSNYCDWDSNTSYKFICEAII